MNEDLWYYISTFLDTKEICNVAWANITESKWYLLDINAMMKIVTFNVIRDLLSTIKRPPQCIVQGCTRSIDFYNIAEFYCLVHDNHEIIEMYSTPWYFYNIY